MTDVVFTLLPDMLMVDAEGDLPLYKSRQFEEAIKKWLISAISQREKDFKVAMQMSEREIMESFTFKKEFDEGSAHHSLKNSMKLDENHVVVHFDTEFTGNDLESSRNLLRQIPQIGFSDENEFMRDLQIVVDENYINDYLYTLFNSEKVFSVTELLFDKWPDQWMGGVLAIRGLMSV